MLPEQKLDALLVRHEAVESELASALSPEIYVKLSREFAELGPVVETVKRYRGIASEIDDLNALIEDPGTDPEMRSMAAAEKPQLEEQRAFQNENVVVTGAAQPEENALEPVLHEDQSEIHVALAR